MGAVNNQTLAAALVGILCGILALLAILGGMRWYRLRTNARALLPTHNDEKADSQNTFVISSSRPHSLVKSIFLSADSKENKTQGPLPEIRITFPEEVDESGKPKSGRCVVVRISEHGSEGYEPVDEKLPSYQRDASDRFQSLDLERIGGLQEKQPMSKSMAAA